MTEAPAAASAAWTGSSSEAHPRQRIVRAVALSTGLAGVVAALAFLLLQATQPSDGAHLRPGGDSVVPDGLIVSPLGEGALMEGDRVVAIEGVPVSSLARRLVGGRAGPPAATPEQVATVRGAWRHGGTVRYRVQRDGELLQVEVPLGRHPLAAAVRRTWGTILFGVTNLLVVTFLMVRRAARRDVQVLFVGAGALLGATTWSLGMHVGDLVSATGFWLFQFTIVVCFGLYWVAVAHFAAVFPRPLPLARRLWFVPAIYGGSLAALGAYLALIAVSVDTPLDRIAKVAPFTGVHASTFLALAMVFVAQQFWRAPVGTARAQIRWVVLAALTSGVGGLLLYLVPPLLGVQPVSANLIGVLATVFPASVAVAVLQFGLFDIDRLLNRAMVYGSWSVAIAVGYALLVAAFGTAFQSRGGPLPGLLATGLIALAVQPLRSRLQRVVDRLMYGQRDDPAAVFGHLGERLEATLAPAAVLPTLASTVAEALRLPYVAIELRSSGKAKIEAAYGKPSREPLPLPLVYRGEVLGALLVEPRSGDDEFAAAEIDLLETIARQAGVAAYALRTREDLRRSRERLVAAREEERRRLRRDLHDGVGPALGALTLKLDAAANVLDRDVGVARALLSELRTEVQAAIDDLRTMVHALRPPVLDDLGLIEALRGQVRRIEHELEVRFEGSDELPVLPAGVELAVFRIVQEALANVVRHAQASRCRVALTTHPGAVVVTVEDDGIGIPSPVPRSKTDATGRTSGVGLESMRERAEELGGRLSISHRLGGGTRIEAHLPVPTDGSA